MRFCHDNSHFKLSKQISTRHLAAQHMELNWMDDWVIQKGREVISCSASTSFLMEVPWTEPAACGPVQHHISFYLMRECVRWAKRGLSSACYPACAVPHLPAPYGVLYYHTQTLLTGESGSLEQLTSIFPDDSVTVIPFHKSKVRDSGRPLSRCSPNVYIY